MTRNKLQTLFLIAVITILGLGASNVYTQEDLKGKTLKGIKRVEVLVEGLDEDGRRLASESELAAIMKRELRRGNIQVVESTTREDRYNFLVVTLTVVQTKAGGESLGAAFTVSLEFKQMVTLDNGDRAMASTWDSSVTAVNSWSSGSDQVKDIVQELMQDFVLASLVANK